MSMGSDKKSQISTYRVVLMNVSSEATKEDIDQVLLGSQIPTSEISINLENATASLTYQTKKKLKSKQYFDPTKNYLTNLILQGCE